jgi:pyruvate/2-oxoglutarate dehydrogenase complex dihydrolipoamide acyltransferase (E2) component
MGETVVRMPRLADTLVEGTLGQWLKHVGDDVSQGEPLASIETDKVTTEISSPGAGTVLEILVAEGQTVPVETPIARIGAPASAPSTPAAGTSPAPKPTPLAARLLAEHGLDARQIASRPGRLTSADVLRYVQSSAALAAKEASVVVRGDVSPSHGEGVVVPLTAMRRAIAEHMGLAFHTIPHGQSVMAADLTELVAWREQNKRAFQENEGANLTFTVLFVHALAKTLAQQTQRGSPVDVGVAVALDGGLIVPVLRAADTLTLAATAKGIAQLAQRARERTLGPDETQGAQMTVTNVGTFGNLTASPIVPMGQIGILGPGLVERRPMPGPGSGVRLGWRCLLSLMFDRRAVSDFAADRLLRGVLEELHHITQRV